MAIISSGHELSLLRAGEREEERKGGKKEREKREEREGRGE